MCWHGELEDRFSPKTHFILWKAWIEREGQRRGDGETESGVYQVRPLQMSPTFSSLHLSVWSCFLPLCVSLQVLFHHLISWQHKHIFCKTMHKWMERVNLSRWVAVEMETCSFEDTGMMCYIRHVLGSCALIVVLETVLRVNARWKEELNMDKGVNKDKDCDRMRISCCFLHGRFGLFPDSVRVRMCVCACACVSVSLAGYCRCL